MNTNVNLEAALGVLAFLGTGFLLGVAALALLYLLKVRNFARARAILFGSFMLAVLYLCLLLAFSFMSSEKALASGEEKYFCEIDCHLAYSVVGVHKTKTLGAGANEVTAKGNFYAITLKTRFDENTISSRRGNSPLTPNSRVVTVTDERGDVYEPSPEGQQALAHAGEASTPLTTPLSPGQAYTTTLVFDLPTDIRNPTLLLREGEFVTHFIIGHENSFWHRKTRFRLEA